MNKKFIIDWAVRLGSVAAVAFLAGNLGAHSTNVASSQPQNDFRDEQNSGVNQGQGAWEMPDEQQELPGGISESHDDDDDTNQPSDSNGLPSDQPSTQPSLGNSAPSQQFGHGEHGRRHRSGQTSGQTGENNGGFFNPGGQGGDTGTHGS